MSLHLITSAQPSNFTNEDPDNPGVWLDPVYIDSLGQPLKSIQFEQMGGAFELYLWGSVDVSVSVIADKRYCLVVPRAFAVADQQCAFIPREIMDLTGQYRFLKLEKVRGVTPKIFFQSTY